jgi:alkanesulfonate monooxygenase SsuD/methylene tetrahydromethanopterin reductase-like flavin-dependent oxidoreductase (luciferase family)
LFEESIMNYGFIITEGDPRTVAELAREVEEAGWDGAFYWDGIYVGEAWEIYDPWVVMAAMAMRTERVRIGAMLSPSLEARPGDYDPGSPLGRTTRDTCRPGSSG